MRRYGIPSLQSVNVPTFCSFWDVPSVLFTIVAAIVLEQEPSLVVVVFVRAHEFYCASFSLTHLDVSNPAIV